MSHTPQSARKNNMKVLSASKNPKSPNTPPKAADVASPLVKSHRKSIRLTEAAISAPTKEFSRVRRRQSESYKDRTKIDQLLAKADMMIMKEREGAHGDDHPQAPIPSPNRLAVPAAGTSSVLTSSTEGSCPEDIFKISVDEPIVLSKEEETKVYHKRDSKSGGRMSGRTTSLPSVENLVSVSPGASALHSPKPEASLVEVYGLKDKKSSRMFGASSRPSRRLLNANLPTDVEIGNNIPEESEVIPEDDIIPFPYKEVDKSMKNKDWWDIIPKHQIWKMDVDALNATLPPHDNEPIHKKDRQISNSSARPEHSWDAKYCEYEDILEALQRLPGFDKELLMFPEEDITVEAIKLSNSYMPKMPKGSHGHIVKCFHYFTNDFLVVKHNFNLQYGGGSSQYDRFTSFLKTKQRHLKEKTKTLPLLEVKPLVQVPEKVDEKQEDNASIETLMESLSKVESIKEEVNKEKVSTPQAHKDDEHHKKNKRARRTSSRRSKRIDKLLIKKEDFEEEKLPPKKEENNQEPHNPLENSDNPRKTETPEPKTENIEKKEITIDSPKATPDKKAEIASHPSHPSRLEKTISTKMSESTLISTGSTNEITLKKEMMEPPSFIPKQTNSELASIFDSYRVEPIAQPTDNRVKGPNPKDTFGCYLMTLLVELKGLSFNGPREPFWIETTLYDVENKIRISETMSTDFNNVKEISDLLSNYQKEKDLETNPKYAIFNFSYISDHIYILFRISRVLKGDIDTVAEPYSKGNVLHEKERTKWFQDTESTTKSFTGYKQPFAWGYSPLFTKNGKLLIKESVIALYKMKPNLTDDVFFDSINSTDKKNIKTLDGQLLLNVKELRSNLFHFKNRRDPSLYFIVPPHKEKDDFSYKTIEEPVREIQDFGITTALPHPYQTMVNNIYVYPHTINFTTYPQKFGKVKHVLIKLNYLNDDRKVDIENNSLEVFYGRSDERKWEKTIQTAVSWNNKKPVFYEEFKVKLPLELKQKDHILFTFINLNVKNKKSTNNEKMESILGYSFLPVADSRIIPDGEHELYVYKELLPNYLDPKVQEQMVVIKNDGKVTPLFSLKTKLVSTIWTQDPTLFQFFLSRDNIESVPSKTISQLVNLDKRLLIEFFPMIINQIIDTLKYEKSTNTQQLAFRCLIDLFRQIDQCNSEVLYLNTFLTYNFRTPDDENDEVSTHLRLIQHWIILTEETVLSTEVKAYLDKTLNDYPEFLFGLIHKSMVLYLHHKDMLHADRRKRFSGVVKEKLLKLMRGIGHYLNLNLITPSYVSLTLKFNKYLALFICDLFGIMDRGFVFLLIHEYFNSLLGDRKTIERINMRLEFMRIIVDYENYVPLLLPFPEDSLSSESHSNIHYRHYLSVILHEDLEGSLDLKNKAMMVKAIKLIRNVAWKHEQDSRYLDPKRRQLLANIYIPVLKVTLKHWKVITESSAEELKDWVITNFWILRYCDAALIRKWFSQEPTTLSTFLEMFSLIVDLYKPQTQKQKLDQVLLGELSLTMLDYINYIMEDYEYDFKHDYSHYEEIFTKLHHMIVLLTRYNTSEEFLHNIFNTLRLFVHKFRTIIFRNQKSSFCIDFCSELLQKCFETAQTLMNVAASILYYIIKQNYTEMGQFLRCKLAFTVAISKLDQKHYPQSLHLFDTFLSYARENDASITNWELNMRDIMSRLYRIASYSSKISTIKDPELKCEVYRNLSVESNNSLEQQVKWLSKLAIVHQELNNFEEAGLAKVLIAAYIADYLTKSRKDELYYLPQNLSYFKTVAPNIVYDLPLRDDCISEPVSSVTFHDSGYIDIITSAIDEMVKANVFEEAVELLASLFQLHKATGNFKKLAGVGRLLQELAEKATKAIEGNLRMFNNYYRVAFYGSKFGELDNTKYIYKEHPSNRLVDFSARLVAQFSELLGVEVKAIPNKPLSELNLDPQGCYIQVISVEPYQDLERVKSKKEITTFDKQHGVDAYGFEAPYGGPDGGKPSDEVSKQWKKRNIYLIPKFFPALTRRLKVCDERQLPLGPLDCAIDLLDNRIELIKLELQLRPPNTKTLQIVLQGSIMLQVNAGPKAIMHYFLGNPGPWDKKKITLLKDKLLEFIRKCGFALRLNTKLIAEEQRAYQQAMEEHFEMFKSEARQYLDV